MKLQSIGMTVAAVVMLVGATMARAAGVPVAIQTTSIRAIQTYEIGQSATDPVYLLLTGTAAGKPIDARIPEGGQTLPAGAKQPAVNSDKPLTLWKGDLDNNQYVLLTVTLMQGKGQDQAKTKDFLAKIQAADKGVSELSKPTLSSADDLKKLAEDMVKAHQAVIKDIKKTFSREQKTDHYGAQFAIIVWNNNGKLMKRLDPVGLTFGQHYGNDEKIYTKLKNTRNNVLVKDAQGQWGEQQMEPLNDDQTAIRVKGLETEWVKQSAGNPIRHVTDYLIEIQVLGPDNKPLTWNTEDEQTGIDAIHTYWNYAD
jgi:hypothetical protein